MSFRDSEITPSSIMKNFEKIDLYPPVVVFYEFSKCGFSSK
jgi:hypothetical protein